MEGVAAVKDDDSVWLHGLVDPGWAQVQARDDERRLRFAALYWGKERATFVAETLPNDLFGASTTGTPSK